jgi:uncharacterized protein DUF5678
VDERQLAIDGLQKWIDEHPDEFRESMERGERDLKFALAHLEEWREQYPNHWIAVFDEKLVAAESSFDRLLKKLREHNVPPAKSYVKFLPEKRLDFRLKIAG